MQDAAQFSIVAKQSLIHRGGGLFNSIPWATNYVMKGSFVISFCIDGAM